MSDFIKTEFFKKSIEQGDEFKECTASLFNLSLSLKSIQDLYTTAFDDRNNTLIDTANKKLDKVINKLQATRECLSKMKFKEYNSIEEINNEILEYNSKIKPILSDVYNVIKPITEQYFIGYSPIECNSLCTEVIDTIDKFNLVEDKEELKNYIEYIKSSIYMLSHYLEALIESNKIRNLDVNTNINKLNIYYDIYNDLYKGLKNMIKN